MRYKVIKTFFGDFDKVIPAFFSSREEAQQYIEDQDESKDTSNYVFTIQEMPKDTPVFRVDYVLLNRCKSKLKDYLNLCSDAEIGSRSYFDYLSLAGLVYEVELYLSRIEKNKYHEVHEYKVQSWQ